MVDAQRMQKISSLGNGKFSTFLLSLYNWRFLFSNKEISNLNYFRLNPNKEFSWRISVSRLFFFVAVAEKKKNNLLTCEFLLTVEKILIHLQF